MRTLMVGKKPASFCFLVAFACDSEYVNSLDLVARLRYYLKLSYDKGASSLSNPCYLKDGQKIPGLGQV